MPKGIRKACANCIKARLACDEGRPCQRCVVHQCECIAVPRKPRVKKQKLDLEPPVVDTKPTNIPTIDSSVDVVVPNWVQTDFTSPNYGAYMDHKPLTMEDMSQYEYTNSPTNILSPSSLGIRLSPSALDSPPLLLSGSSTPSPPQQQQPSPPQSAQNNWVQRQLQAALLQQYVSQNASLPSPMQQPAQPASIQSQPQPTQQQQQSPQPTTTIQQPVATVQDPQAALQATLQQLTAQQQALIAHLQRQQQAQMMNRPYDHTQQMLSLLMDEKPSTLLTNDWQDNSFGNYFDGQQTMNFATPFKNASPKHAHMNPLPPAKNSTPLFPAPIAVFDKQRFQLLDANEAMANFVGHNTIASLSTEVVTMDDLLNPEASHIAKNAYINFIATPSPCFRIGDVRVRGGQTKTVEFHVDLTEQLLIFTVKSVLDTCPSAALPNTTHTLVKKDILPSQQCNCKACEFLSPID